MVSPSNFVDGSEIQWRKLAAALAGSVSLSWTLGTTGLLMDSVAFVIDTLGAVEQWLMGLSDYTASIYVGSLDTATASWAAFATVLGPAAFPAGVGIVVVTIAILRWGFSNV